MRRPDEVSLESKLEAFYCLLKKENPLKVAINKCIDVLKDNMLAGEQIRKRLIKYYVRKFG